MSDSDWHNGLTVRHVTLTVIPEPPAGTPHVVTKSGAGRSGTAWMMPRGHASTAVLHCGQCGGYLATIIDHVRDVDLFTFHCETCGSFNHCHQL